jgi:hypothetical protein
VPRRLETLARRLFGPPVDRIVREVPWEHVWVGNPMLSQSSYILQGFDQPIRLPKLRFEVAVPAPLELELELQPPESFDCVPFDVPGLPNFAMTKEEGAVAVRVPFGARARLSLGGSSRSWEFPPEGDLVFGWQREAKQLRVWLAAGDLEFPLSPRPRTLDSQARGTLDRLRGWEDLLVDAVERPGDHLGQTLALLERLGFEGLPGRTWVRLHRIAREGKLADRDAKALGPLVVPGVPVSAEDAALFTWEHGSGRRPRLFVAGTELEAWTAAGQEDVVRAPVSGLVPVRGEDPEGRALFSFMTVLQRGVRIQVTDHWGPKLVDPSPGLRCGRTPRAKKQVAGVQQDLRWQVRPMSSADLVHVGKVPVVASLPGLYLVDDRGRVSFDPTYGGRTAAPARCGEPGTAPSPRE